MQVTGFSNTEEEAIKRAALVPFLLEDRIREVCSSTVTPTEASTSKVSFRLVDFSDRCSN